MFLSYFYIMFLLTLSRFSFPYPIHPRSNHFSILHLHPPQSLIQPFFFGVLTANSASTGARCRTMYRQSLYPVLLPNSGGPPEEQFLAQFPLSEDNHQVSVVPLDLG